MLYLATHSLADAPFEWFAKYLAGGDWERTVTEVHRRASQQLGCSIGQWLNGECLSFDAVDQVLRCYTNLATDGKIPEYERPEDRTKINQILTAVTACSGASWERAHVCLYFLYDATLDGTIPTALVLRPKTSQKYEAQRQTPAAVSSWDSGAGKLLTYAKWGLGLGVVGFVLYEANQTFGLVEKIRGSK